MGDKENNIPAQNRLFLKYQLHLDAKFANSLCGENVISEDI